LDSKYPLLINEDKEIRFADLINYKNISLNRIQRGSVVALIGDFEINTLNILLKIIEKTCIIIPLTNENEKKQKK